jgi:AraC-like DNA-binding protein
MEINKMEKKSPAIVYSCYHQISREGENFVTEHVLSYQISGSLILNDGSKDYNPEAGSFRLIRRNQLMKFVKIPPENAEFKSISIYLDKKTLRNFSNEYDLNVTEKFQGPSVIDLKTSPLLKNYCNSLLEHQLDGSLENQELMELKIKEGLLLILQKNPELKNTLFDFTEPFKINLEDFMNNNYHFNVPLERFAYLTGRSLATFKRDFLKTFGTSPGRWLQHKRLEQAHILITEKGKKASLIYLDLGFIDLSHFSFAYKKMYGLPPSKQIYKH